MFVNVKPMECSQCGSTDYIRWTSPTGASGVRCNMCGHEVITRWPWQGSEKEMITYTTDGTEANKF